MPAPLNGGRTPGVRVHCSTCAQEHTHHLDAPCAACFDVKAGAFRNWEPRL
ncbi:hypothetical protein [Caldimonas tepidiphila]|uniref:hypothetical protein n=1 Tax=Caldimonas tepidiphila TaxID=2315841 RepID=UPI0013003B50|nr:hypothetical protein [Caldimonas tepidiphila]